MLENFELQRWRANTQDILRGKTWSLKFTKTFQEAIKFIVANEWQGACHAISSVVYVLLAEQGVTSTLCIGEVSIRQMAFNHSWLEIDGEVYDIAILATLDDDISFSPTIRNHDIESKQLSNLHYGAKTGLPDDPPTSHIKNTSFGSFMDEFPHHQDGLWGIAVLIGTKLGLSLNVDSLKSKYSAVSWKTAS